LAEVVVGCLTREGERRRSPKAGAVAQVDIGLPLIIAVGRGADDGIGVAVGIHIPGGGNQLSERACLPGEDVRSREREVRVGNPQVQKGSARVLVVPRRAHQKVGVAVVVHIAGAGDRIAKFFTACLPRQGERGRDAEARGRAEINVDAPSASVVTVFAYDDIGVAVAIHVGTRDRASKVGGVGGDVARQAETLGGVHQPRGAAEIDVNAPLLLARIIARRPHNDVGIAVAVDIAGSKSRAEFVSNVFSRLRPVDGSDCQRRRWLLAGDRPKSFSANHRSQNPDSEETKDYFFQYRHVACGIATNV
jgi:hypothetical protein